MKWLKIFIIAIVGLMIISLAQAVYSEYTYSSVKTCDEGKCSLTLYSGTQFAKDKNGSWKDFREVESLKEWRKKPDTWGV
jgi:hypothetical protein